MRIAYFDCSYGIAGDMILGALVDAGAPFAKLKKEIESGLNVHGLKLSRQSVERGGIVGTRVIVKIDKEHDHHRHLAQIEDIIGRTHFSAPVKERALEAFRRLARAEAKVHNTAVEKIHFHEVGCLDAIADVTGGMLAMEMLGIDRVEASPLVVGSGTARCAHGVIPVPGPATLELLRGVPFESGPFAMEMVTPTGAAVLTSVSSDFGAQPLMKLESIGYGAGKREIEKRANFLRVLIGEAPGASINPDNKQASPALHSMRLNLLMTEIDDMSPELLGDLMERLFRAGCLDAHFTPIQMKKNRPGTQIQVLCRPEQKGEMAELLLRHTSTFGLKIMEMERVCLPRRMEKIETDLGVLDVKVGLWEDSILKVTPEYESCRRLAESSKLPLAEVYSRAGVQIQQHYFANSSKSRKMKKASAGVGGKRKNP